MRETQNIPNVLCLIFLAAIWYIGYFTRQNQFLSISIGFTVSFAVYYWFLCTDFSVYYKLILVGIIARVGLLFSFPSLTDDLYRYWWDGYLINAGISPFANLPGYYLLPENAVAGINESIYNQLNSQEYYSIYPAFSQAIFAIAAKFSGGSALGAAFVMRIFILIAELGSIFLVFRLTLNVLESVAKARQAAFLYAMNPLVIIELTNGLHTEVFMIFFALLSLYFLMKGKLLRSSIIMGFSLASKFMPLIFFPVVLKRIGFLKTVIWAGLSILLFVGSFWLILPSPEQISNLLSSINLYFQKFEFNGSFFYLARDLGWRYFGYDRVAQLGPMFGVFTILAIAVSTILGETTKKPSFFGLLSLCLIIHLLFSTTVHPWYVLFPFTLSLIAGQKYVLVWTSLIWLTYINYSYSPYFENLWVVGLEYGGVLLFLITKAFRYRLTKNRNSL